MRKSIIITVLFGSLLFCNLFLASCATSAYAQEVVVTDVDVDDNVDINIVIHNGAKFYYEGSLLYYLYNDWYYYPYRTNGHIYYYRYREPLPLYRGYRFVPMHNHRHYRMVDRRHFDNNRHPVKPRSSTYHHVPNRNVNHGNRPSANHGGGNINHENRSFGGHGGTTHHGGPSGHRGGGRR